MKLDEPCTVGDVCLDDLAECAGGVCACLGDLSAVNNRCGECKQRGGAAVRIYKLCH